MGLGSGLVSLCLCSKAHGLGKVGEHSEAASLQGCCIHGPQEALAQGEALAGREQEVQSHRAIPVLVLFQVPRLPHAPGGPGHGKHIPSLFQWVVLAAFCLLPHFHAVMCLGMANAHPVIHHPPI